MKRSLLFLALAFCVGFVPLKAQRYLTEVFTSFQVMSNVNYGTNVSVLTGAPATTPLFADIYMPPASDTMTMRPVILLAHSGSFLPPGLNGSCTGDKNDSVVVAMCRQFAMRGFVAIAYDYRLGWNPVSPDQDTRTSTLLNAAYRGIQDTWTLVRYLRMDVDSMGNSYGVNVDQVISGGIGTGGYISLGVGHLDKYSEITLSKFLDFDITPPEPYVDTSLSSNNYGTTNRPLNIYNHPGYDNEVAMVFNMGGAVGDSTWIEAGEVPSVSFHVPSDPFAPYDFGAVIVPTTGDFVVNVSGSQGVQRQQNRFDNNQPYTQYTFNDPYTQRADAINDGLKGLFPFIRPTPESGPWDYWDTTACDSATSANGFITNPDMSEMKAMTYIDSIMGYMVPRIVCGIGLSQCAQAVAIDNVLEEGAVTVFPNPAKDILHVRSNMANNMINAVSMIDLQGRVIYSRSGLKLFDYSFTPQGLSPGLYFVKIDTQKGQLTRKIVIE